MIAIDTNVLVRFFFQDDSQQSKQVKDWVKSTQASGEQIFVPDIVLVEFNWVASRIFRASREVIAEAFFELFNESLVCFEHNDTEILRVFYAFRDQSLDLPDLLISARAKSMGCTATVTFDQAAIKAGLMVPLGAV